MEAVKDDGSFQTFIAYFLHLLHLISLAAASAATKVVIKRKLLPWNAHAAARPARGKIDSPPGHTNQLMLQFPTASTRDLFSCVVCS